MVYGAHRTLPNPLYDPRKNPVCLFVKDPQREYKDLLESLEIGFISRVVGVKKLQGKVSPSGMLFARC